MSYQIKREELVSLLVSSELDKRVWSYGPPQAPWGDEQWCFPDDIRVEFQERWKKQYGVDVEESLNISGFDVSRIATTIAEAVADWCFDYQDATPEQLASWLSDRGGADS